MILAGICPSWDWLLALLVFGIWTSPRTWVAGELVTASMMNVHVRDNLLFLVNRISASTRTVMTGNVTLVDISTPYQFFDPDANRDVTLPTATQDMIFVITNFDAAGFLLTVKDAAAATLFTLVNGQTVTFMYDGVAWQVIS